VQTLDAQMQEQRAAQAEEDARRAEERERVRMAAEQAAAQQALDAEATRLVSVLAVCSFTDESWVSVTWGRGATG
jgi:phage terminase Nu1 subunit (DNA packaging protein)